MNFEISEQHPGFDDLLDDRDYLLRLLDTIDWDAQLDAIESVLARNRSAAEDVAATIAGLEEQAKTYSGPYHDHVVDQHIEAIWRSAYSDAAISLAALGMIVPMAESVFSQSFQALGSMYVAKQMQPPDHPRWKRSEQHPQRWNCQMYFGHQEVRSDIISGLRQISQATGLLAYLGPDVMDWLSAMLTYRNKMFHGGFEWSLAQRDQFENQIKSQNWDKYFQSARTNDKPWIFYLRDEVIDDMPRRMKSILDSFGRFAKDLPFDLVSIS